MADVWAFTKRYGVTLASAALHLSARERVDVAQLLTDGGGWLVTENEGLAGSAS